MRRRAACPCSRSFTKKEAARAARKLGLPRGVSVEALLEGMQVEREHGDVTGCDAEKTARIALAHLRERSDYYGRLKIYVEDAT